MFGFLLTPKDLTPDTREVTIPARATAPFGAAALAKTANRQEKWNEYLAKKEKECNFADLKKYIIK